MSVVLEPLSHPEIGEITIQNSLFAVGRFETPFESFEAAAVNRLSRRHARIFKEGESYYVTDLGSTNGTTLNNIDVKDQPVELHSGDQLGFAELVFNVKLGADDETRVIAKIQPSPIQLLLHPAHPDSGLNSIQVTEFPFLIGKTNQAFAGDIQTDPEEMNYLSRRHALIFHKHDDLYIEDLGSTNGTFVDGKRLDEHALVLSDGDTIAIGGDHFVYDVCIQKQPQNGMAEPTQNMAPLTPESKASEHRSNTTFITTVTSFLDIFCPQEQEYGEQQPIIKDTEAVKGAHSAGAFSGADSRSQQGPLGTLRKASFILKEIRLLFPKRKPADIRRIWIASAAIGLISIIFMGLYLRGVTQRKISNLMAAGEYAQSVALSNQYLETHQGDSAVIELASESVAKSVMPEWIKALRTNDFPVAQSLLHAAMQQSRFNREGLALLKAMEWIVKLEQFMFDRGGPEGPIIIFRHETRIKSLLSWWQADVSEHRRQLSRLLRYVPAFEATYYRVISHTRKLRSDRSLYLKAIDELNETIQEKFAADTVGELKDSFSQFQRRYPDIGGMEPLRQDLEHYIALEQARQADDLSKIVRLSREMTFHTPPFREHVSQWITNNLPPAAVQSQYELARESWKIGDSDRAIAILQGLQYREWSRFMTQKLDYYQRIAQKFIALKAARNTQDYVDQALRFYNALDVDEDRYYRHAIEVDFQRNKAEGIKRAVGNSKRARQHWERYLQNGGIDGVNRAESNLSESFRQQARELSEAFQCASHSTSLYSLLKMSPAESWVQLNTEIKNEVKRQRQWLIELGMVLNPRLLRAKLELLPELEKDRP